MSQRGDISVYIALIVLSVVVSSALVFTLIMAKQLRSTEDVVSSERAFYAADTGLERGLYPMAQKDPNLYDQSVNTTGTIDYPTAGEQATFSVIGRIVDLSTGVVCIEVSGNFHALQRRFKLGPNGCSTT